MKYKETLDAMYDAYMAKNAGKREEFMAMVDSPRKTQISNLFQQLEGLKSLELTTQDQSQLRSVRIEIEKVERDISNF